MAGEERQAGKPFGHDPHRKVPGTASRSGVARVVMAVILDGEPAGGEFGFQQRADRRHPLTHGRALI